MAALFFRGAGINSINIPSMAAAYATVPRSVIPAASTAVNVVQRFGGPTLTNAVSLFLAWTLNRGSSEVAPGHGFAKAFGLLCIFHLFCLVLTLGLPRFIDATAKRSPDSTASKGSWTNLVLPWAVPWK
jgi:hypothetical protein